MKILSIALLIITNCTSTIAPGIIFNSTSEHVYLDKHISMIGGGKIYKKVESCTHNSILIQFFYYGKPSSIESLLKENKISRIGVIDYRSFNILGYLFYTHCTIIRGEVDEN
ncbi:MAG: TRL domain-containing protein [Leptospiraceae bacterium]|nr:TRL domain-containing protein [Leptospiraceae bacterium]